MISKPLLFRMAAVLFGCAVAFAVLFLFQCGREWFSRMFHLPQRQIAQKSLYHNSPFYFNFHARPSALMPVLESFSEDNRFHARHNSHGFRTPEYTIAHPPDTFRILVIGDSFTWGQGVTMEETFPYVLNSLLVQNCSGLKFEVISLGVCGHRFAENLLKLLVHGQFLNPDLVIVQVCFNDIDFFDYTGIQSYQGGDSAVYRTQRMRALDENSIDWNVFKEVLDEFQRWSHSKSVPVAFLLFPGLDVTRKTHNFHHYDPEVLSRFPYIQEFE